MSAPPLPTFKVTEMYKPSLRGMITARAVIDQDHLPNRKLRPFQKIMMLKVLACLGALPVIFAPLSLQRDHCINLRGVDSASRCSISVSGEKPPALDTSLEEFSSRRPDDIKYGAVRCETDKPEDVTSTPHQWPSSESLDLELTLMSGNRRKNSNPNFARKRLCSHSKTSSGDKSVIHCLKSGNIREATGSINWMNSLEVKERMMKPTKMVQQNSLGSPWLTLRQPMSVHPNDSIQNPGELHSTQGTLDKMAHGTASRSWLTLGHQSDVLDTRNEQHQISEAQVPGRGTTKVWGKTVVIPPKSTLRDSPHISHRDSNANHAEFQLGNVQWRGSDSQPVFKPKVLQQVSDISRLEQSTFASRLNSKDKSIITAKSFKERNYMEPSTSALPRFDRNIILEPRLTDDLKHQPYLTEQLIGPVSEKISSALVKKVRAIGKQQKASLDTHNFRISDWFSGLRILVANQLKQIQKSPQIMHLRGNDFVGAVGVAETGIATCFLGLLYVFLGDHNQKEIGLDQALMDRGLKFVQSLFVKWADLDWKRLNTYSLRKIDHLDGTQPEVLLNYLPHIGAGYIPIKHLWEIWVKWAREVKYPGIPFLPTESDFVQHLRYSLMKKGLGDYHEGEAEFLKPPISCGNLSKQELIHQHGIQFFANLGLDPGHQPSYYNICQFAQHLGRLQLRLLEHHEPVAEWFDNLSHSLQEQLYHLGNNHEYPRDSKETIYCVKRLYLNLVPSFFGILTILEDNYFPLKASNKDRLITNAWAFLKQHLTQWKNLSLKMSSTQESVPDIPENPYFKTYQVLDRVFRMKPKKYVKLQNLLELYEIGHLDLSNKNPRVLSQSKKISLEEKLKAFYVHMSQEASNKSWNKA